MIKKNILLSAVLLASLSSCGIYTKYQPETKVSDKLFGDSVLGKSITEYQGKALRNDSLQNDSTTLGFMDWHDLFTDPLLLQYIDRGLSQNTDYQQAMLRVEEASATLKAAKLAFLPSFAISPQAGVSSFDGGKASQTYSVPLNVSWEVDVFGRMRNAKEQAKALYAKSQDYQQAVHTQLIANISNIYYSLIALDQQLSLSVKTEEAWRETLQTARALMKAGRYDESGVAQMEATLHNVHTSVLDLKSQIAQTENSMAVILGETPRHYERSKEILIDGSAASDGNTSVSNGNISVSEKKSNGIFDKISIGVPLQLLSSRPDVRQAERTIESAFYGVNQARSAFYPTLTLSGSIGWTNSAGNMIVNPGKALASALASLVAPVFTRGQNEAQLKIAKAQQEEAKLAFTQTLLNAGKEVNDALTAYQTSVEKETSIASEIKSLEKALRSTTLLMEHGTNTYLEVLTARQSLLSAQLSETANKLTKTQNIISLYQALGGGQDNALPKDSTVHSENDQ